MGEIAYKPKRFRNSTCDKRFSDQSENCAKNKSSSLGFSQEPRTEHRYPQKESVFSLIDRAYVVIGLLGGSFAWSSLFMRYFSGLSCVNALLPWGLEVGVLKLVLILSGFIISLSVGLLANKRRRLSLSEGFLFSAVHVGLFSTLYTCSVNVYWLVYWIFIIGCYSIWRLYLLSYAAKTRKELASENPLRGIGIVLLLTSLLLLPPTSFHEYFASISDQKSELQYYVEPIEQLDSAEIEANLAVFDSEWDTYSLDDKLGALAFVVHYECNELGCTVPEFATEALEPNVYGEFRTSDNTIVVNKTYLESLSLIEILPTVLHEVRHVYQNQCQQMVEILAESHPEYLSLSDLKGIVELSTADLQHDPYSYLSRHEAYKNNPFEIDARDYESRRIEEYQALLSGATSGGGES